MFPADRWPHGVGRRGGRRDAGRWRGYPGRGHGHRRSETWIAGADLGEDPAVVSRSASIAPLCCRRYSLLLRDALPPAPPGDGHLGRRPTRRSWPPRRPRPRPWRPPPPRPGIRVVCAAPVTGARLLDSPSRRLTVVEGNERVADRLPGLESEVGSFCSSTRLKRQDQSLGGGANSECRLCYALALAKDDGRAAQLTDQFGTYDDRITHQEANHQEADRRLQERHGRRHPRQSTSPGTA